MSIVILFAEEVECSDEEISSEEEVSSDESADDIEESADDSDESADESEESNDSGSEETPPAKRKKCNTDNGKATGIMKHLLLGWEFLGFRIGYCVVNSSSQTNKV